MLTQLADRWGLAGLLDFVFPSLCSGCGEYTDSPTGICVRCRARIDWYLSPFELHDKPHTDAESDVQPLGRHRPGLVFPLFAGGDYVDPLKRVVIQFKFHGARTAVKGLAEQVGSTFRRTLERLKPFTLLPVPLHPSREYMRGYNQAEVFAEAVAEYIECDVESSLLVRTRRRRPQARLKQADRVINIAGVFNVAVSPDESGISRVMLVDDVVTSGATVREARRVLIESGYDVIGAMAIAHGV